ncbi:MAG: hypothetical protein ACI90A_000645 [Shewanella sp.]|jgi:hypothetical protein
MLEQYEITLYEWIDDVVAQDNDDTLFASGYLQGHFAVAISQLETETVQDFSALCEKMVSCMELAKQELGDADYELVDTAWKQLSDRLAA